MAISSVPLDRPPGVATPHHAPALRWALIGVLGLVTANALYGGVGLMVNGLGMPGDWLDGTPFASWVLPGVALLVLVAVPQAVALVALVRDRPGADRWVLAAGVMLMAWIAVQLAVLQRYFFLQPVIFAFGAVEVTLAWLRSRVR